MLTEVVSVCVSVDVMLGAADAREGWVDVGWCSEAALGLEGGVVVADCDAVMLCMRLVFPGR
jgi:hypothetical protein